MLRKLVPAIMLSAVIATPAIAAATYYVAKDAKTNKCSVVDKKPDGKMAMDVGTMPYATEANAKDALSKLKDCK